MVLFALETRCFQFWVNTPRVELQAWEYLSEEALQGQGPTSIPGSRQGLAMAQRNSWRPREARVKANRRQGGPKSL